VELIGILMVFVGGVMVGWALRDRTEPLRESIDFQKNPQG